jgi:hypothetical protein
MCFLGSRAPTILTGVSNTTLLCYRKISRHSDKKENQIFLIYKEIQSGAVAKSYMMKSFLIYEEMRNMSPYMRRPLVRYDFATAPFRISLYMRKI